MAHGVAVLASRRGEYDLEGEALAPSSELIAYARTAGVGLDYHPDSLHDLDRLIDSARDDPEICSWMGNEAGTYLGAVLVRAISGARWHVWPNGYPVVRLRSGQDLDVVDLAHSRVGRGSPRFTEVYERARPHR